MWKDSTGLFREMATIYVNLRVLSFAAVISTVYIFIRSIDAHVTNEDYLIRFTTRYK